MPTKADRLDELTDLIRAVRGEAEIIGELLNVKFGRGITARKASVDPLPLLDQLEGASDDDARRLAAGWVRGLQHALLEPKRSSAAEWSFAETAGRLVPSIELPTFAHGVAAAGGSPAFTLPLAGDLVQAFVVELDRGVRALPQDQVERWGVSHDRVRAAARSLLYHKSRNVEPEPHEDIAGVEVIATGDDFDAARSLVVADLFYSDFDSAYRFAMPSPDALLFVRTDDAAALDALGEATDAAFEAADFPLSRSVFRFELGKPTLAEER